jgi:hypothetical protein
VREKNQGRWERHSKADCEKRSNAYVMWGKIGGGQMGTYQLTSVPMPGRVFQPDQGQLVNILHREEGSVGCVCG